MSEDWPRGEAERIVRELRQGDLLATSVAVVLEAPGSTIIAGAESLETVDEHGIWAPAAQAIDSGWAAIVTQTCDVVRAIDTHQHLQVMPIVALDEDEWNRSLNGRRGTHFSLPPAEGVDIEFPAIDCVSPSRWPRRRSPTPRCRRSLLRWIPQRGCCSTTG